MSVGRAGRRARPGELRHDESMARYTGWRTGGAAQRLYCPRDSADLVRFLRQLPPTETLFWCGLGSNLLVRDGGVSGTVIFTQGGLDGLSIEGQRVRAEAGVRCGRLAKATLREGLAGLEMLAGIPGTVGGALAMNAGADGRETWDGIEEVETVDRYGTLRRRRADAFTVGYRQVVGPPGEAFIAATWRLEAALPDALRARVRALLQRRSATQPLGVASCGSVFRNPPDDAAGRLIEAAGLKGVSCGKARVSERHANFIVNDGASAAEIEALIERVRDRVAEVHGVRLELEVHVVGEAAQ